MLKVAPQLPGLNLPPLGADSAAAEARHRRDGGESRAVGSVISDISCVGRPMEEESSYSNPT